jgi:hypothetical protein
MATNNASHDPAQQFDPDDWAQNYYLHRRPDELPRLLHYYRGGTLTSPRCYYQLLGFFAELFGRNPDRLGNWLQDWSTYSPGDQRFLSHALWLTGMKESRSFLRSVKDRPGGREHDNPGSALGEPFYGIFLISGDSVISTSGGIVKDGVNCSVAIGTYPIDVADQDWVGEDLPEHIFLAFLQRCSRDEIFRRDMPDLARAVLHRADEFLPSYRDDLGALTDLECYYELLGLFDEPPTGSPEGIAIRTPMPDRDATLQPFGQNGLIDFSWSRFFASGDSEYIQTIISFLRVFVATNPHERREGKINLAPWLMGQAAHWSLEANARRHRRVVELCRSELPAYEKPVRDLLEAIVIRN